MALYLGIDGGGSKTKCTAGDDSNVLSTVSVGGSNPQRIGVERACGVLCAAVQAALEMAGAKSSDVRSACVGMAGAAAAQTQSVVRQALRDFGLREVQVAGDMEIAMEAAFGEMPGMVTIAGTGSIAFGRNSAGRSARVGGWGHAISDEGSGYWIGRRAVSTVMQCADLGLINRLESAVLGAWRLNNRDELVRDANRMPAPDFASLVPAVFRAAEAGDEHAAALLSDAGTELARLAATVARQLWKPEEWVRVGLGGGVFRHVSRVRQTFYRELRIMRPRVAVNFAMIEPVSGALAMARRRASSG